MPFDFRGGPGGEYPQDLEVPLRPILRLGVDDGQMTEYFAANVAQWNRQIGLGAHLLQILLLSWELLHYLAVVGDYLAAENTLAGRPRQLIVEVLIHAPAVPHREHMHAGVLVAEVRDERIASIQCLC